MKSTIMIACRRQLMREGLYAMLKHDPGCEVTAVIGDGALALRHAIDVRPQLALIDLDLPSINGVDVTRRIRDNSASTRVLCIDDSCRGTLIRAAIDAGAHGLIAADSSSEELMRAMRCLLARQMYFSPEIMAIAVKPGARGRLEGIFDTLTPKEREVVQLIAEGNSTKQAAARLNISFKTVATHRSRVMTKLRLRSVAELTRYAIQEGIVAL